MNPALQTLLQRADIWRAKTGATTAPSALSSGFLPLDKALHGGWPSGALTELLLERTGIGELGLLMPLFRQPIHPAIKPRQLVIKPRQQVWIDPPLLPNAPALLQHGIALDELLIVRPTDRAQWLWTCVQALRAGRDIAVLCWPNAHRLRYAEVRQLQVTASSYGSVGFLLRDLMQDRRPLQHSTPAPLRLHLTAQRDALKIEVLKQRGSAAGQHILLARDAALRAQIPLRKRTFNFDKTLAPRLPRSPASLKISEPQRL